MRASTAILALAGTALAAPKWNQPENKEVVNVHVVYETAFHTVYVNADQAKATPAEYQSAYVAPVTTTPTSEYIASPTPSSEVVVYETPSSTKSEAPAPSATPSGYQAVVDTWRAKLGLKALANDAKLQSNAMDTVVSSNGQMVHKLNPGTYGQVLAPGNESDFEHVFVGGWLCEIPTLPGLDGVCTTQSDGWSYNGQTGHAEILTSTSYSKIGCALHAGIWCCDLA